ncbi:MAG: DUF6152 family protein [Rhodothermales bacterium]|nr:DUF6152 family protein [Rhodothermales bacterium]
MVRAHTAIVVGILAVTAVARAHHSASIYESDSVLTLQGTVRSYEWKNPHVYIYMDVVDQAGETIEWEIEGGSTPLMMRSGWTATTLVPGEKVSVRINPNKNAAVNNGWLLEISSNRGTSLNRWVEDTTSAVAAEGIAGVWDALRGFQAMEFHRGRLTERGEAARASYHETQNPVKDCIPAPAPVLTYMPYRTRITILDDRVLLHTEYFDVERVVYMDGRAHPENIERTNQGHSIGRWDGAALVVDTIGFADSPIGSGMNVPSGPRKHLVERFELAESRTQLKVSFSIDDPDFIVGNSTGQLMWDYVADGELTPYECDPEVARRYVFE